MDVLPGEQKKVLLENGLDVVGSETAADGAAVLVINDARG